MEFRQIENNSSAVAELLEQNNLSRSGLTDNNVFLFALFKGDEILGAGALAVIDTFSMLRSVCINKKYQKNRLGSDLCGHLYEKAQALGLKDIYLLTDTAEGFFKKQKFETISRKELPIILEQNVLVQNACSTNSTVMHRKL